MDTNKRSRINLHHPKSWVLLVSAVIGAAAVIWAAVITSDTQRRLESKNEQILALQEQLSSAEATPAHPEGLVEELRAKFASEQREKQKLQSEFNQLQEQLKDCRSVTPNPEPQPSQPPPEPPPTRDGYSFLLEACEAAGSDLDCWILVTNSRERRELSIFVDGSWLRDQRGNSYNVRRILHSDGEEEFNIHNLGIPSDSKARFGIRFSGLARLEITDGILNIRILGADVEIRGVTVN